MGDARQLTPVKATSRREGDTLRQTVQIREHQLTVDEPRSVGGEDAGPDPRELLAASLASCTAITMELYAARKGWEVGTIEVEVEQTPAEHDVPAKFVIVLRIPAEVPDERAERLAVIAAKCPVRRALEGEATFEERVERLHLAA